MIFIDNKQYHLINELLNHLLSLGLNPTAVENSENTFEIKISPICIIFLEVKVNMIELQASIPQGNSIVSDIKKWMIFSNLIKENAYKETIHLNIDKKSNELNLATTVCLSSIWNREDLDEILIGFIDFFHWLIKSLED